METVKSILDRVTMGSTGRVDAHDPVVVKTDKEVCKQVQGGAIQARATHMCVNLHVTDWVATQWEDPVLKATIDWISNWKVQNLKHLFGDDANTEDGLAVLWEQKRLMLYQGALYHCHTPDGELEGVMQFVVPTAHQRAAMNRCHWDAGHQGQQWMLYLLQDWFWWSSMAAQMHKVINKCKWCIQYEGICAKAPMQPIIATASLELPHVDFMSIEMTMELCQPLNMVNVLVFCNHFTAHIMAYMTTEQTVKIVAKFLWQWCTTIFGAPDKLLSNQGTTFESDIIKELCELMGIWKVRLHLTKLRPTNKLSELTKYLCAW